MTYDEDLKLLDFKNTLTLLCSEFRLFIYHQMFFLAYCFSYVFNNSFNICVWVLWYIDKCNKDPDRKRKSV